MADELISPTSKTTPRNRRKSCEVPPAPPEPPADPDDQETVEVNGTRLVPLSALKAVREEVKGLKGAALQAQTLAQQVAALQGQLQGYQQVTQQLRQPVAAPAEPKADPNALKFAQRLDLYRQDASGQAVPDVEKAQELLGIIEQVAEQKASQHLGPVKERAAQEASARNYQWAISQKTPAGKPINKDVLTQMWRAFPAAATADPMIAQTLVYTATGADVWQQTPPVAAPRTRRSIPKASAAIRGPVR
jgi:hypothetical protein